MENDVTEVTSSGTYRIFAFDQGAINGNLGVKIQSGMQTYWVEYRTTGDADTNSVQINVQGVYETETNEDYFKTTSYLLDMTPDSNQPDEDAGEWFGNDFKDAGLVIGKSYTDEVSGKFTITPTRTGGTQGTANAWIEVEVMMH